MPDQNYVPSKAAQDDFIRWMNEYYNLDMSFFQVPDIMVRFANRENPYWQYWSQNVWTPAHPAETPPDPTESVLAESYPSDSYPSGEPFPDVPGQYPLHFPERMKGIPVNYLTLFTTKEKYPRKIISPEDGSEQEVNDYITIYGAVPPLEELNDKTFKDITNNLYAVWPDGEIAFERRELKASELGMDIYDPINKKLTDKAKAAFYEDISQAAMTKWAEDKYGAMSDNMTDYIKEQAANWGKGIAPNLDVFGEDLNKMTPAWQIAHPEEEAARLAKQFPITPAQEAQHREALFSRFDKPEEQFATEVDKLNNTLKDFQQSYDKYKPMQAQLSNDAEGQYANTIINLYENAQNMLQQIKGKGTITTTGYTETGQKMTGERPYQIGQHTPSESATLASVAGNLGVPANQIAALGQKYITDTDHPDFKNLTQSEKQELLRAGNVTLNQTAGEAQAQQQQTQQQADWDNLLKKAKAVNYPQRKVRL